MTTLTIQQPGGFSLDQGMRHGLDFPGALHSALQEVGDRFGLYDVMIRCGPVTPDCLATQAGIPQQAAHTWLDAQAAGGYLNHCVRSDLYCLWAPWPRMAR